MQVKKNIAISDSGFLFNPSSGDSYSVNPVGQDILKLLKEGQSDELIIDFMLENYMTDKDTIEKDLYDFKKMLENYRLTEEKVE